MTALFAITEASKYTYHTNTSQPTSPTMLHQVSDLATATHDAPVAKHTEHSPKALQAALPANLFNLDNTPTAIHAMSST